MALKNKIFLLTLNTFVYYILKVLKCEKLHNFLLNKNDLAFNVSKNS